MFIPGFAGGGFVALAGRGYAVAECAPGVAHPAGQHTFSGAVHTPIEKKTRILNLHTEGSCFKEALNLRNGGKFCFS